MNNRHKKPINNGEVRKLSRNFILAGNQYRTHYVTKITKGRYGTALKAEFWLVVEAPAKIRDYIFERLCILAPEAMKGVRLIK